MLTKTALRDMKKELKDRLIDISVEAQSIEKQLDALDVLIAPLKTPSGNKKLNGSKRYNAKRNVRHGFVSGKTATLDEIMNTPYEKLAVPPAMIKIWEEIDPNTPFTAKDMAKKLQAKGMPSNSVTPLVAIAASVSSAMTSNKRVRDYYKHVGETDSGVKVYRRRKFVNLERAK